MELSARRKISIKFNGVNRILCNIPQKFSATLIPNQIFINFNFGKQIVLWFFFHQVTNYNSFSCFSLIISRPATSLNWLVLLLFLFHNQTIRNVISVLSVSFAFFFWRVPKSTSSNGAIRCDLSQPWTRRVPWPFFFSQIGLNLSRIAS